MGKIGEDEAPGIIEYLNSSLPGLNMEEASEVTDGVFCWAYKNPNDNEKDLGIVLVSAGYSTPRQLVKKGDETVEVFFAGKGKFYIERSNYILEFVCDENRIFEMEVLVGDIMHWEAPEDSDLIFYEICYPPFTKERFLTV